MANGTQEQIQRQREDFARARSQISQAQSQLPQITQRQLRQGSISPLMGRLQRRQISSEQDRLKQAQEEVLGKQTAFETEVAIKAPQYADPEVKQRIISETKKGLQKEVENLKKELKGTTTEDERKKIQREINVYQRLLAGKKSKGGLSETEFLLLGATGKGASEVKKLARRVALLPSQNITTYITTEEISGYTYTSPSGIKYLTDASGKLQGVEDLYKGESRNATQSDKLVFESLKRQAPVSSYVPVGKPSWETPFSRLTYDIFETTKKILPESTKKLLVPEGAVYSERGKVVGITPEAYQRRFKEVTIPLYTAPRYINNKDLTYNTFGLQRNIFPESTKKLFPSESSSTITPEKLISEKEKKNQLSFKIDPQTLMLESSVYGVPSAFGGQAVKTPTYVKDFFFDKEIVNIPIKTRAIPQTETFIISDPTLKSRVITKAPGLLELEERGTSLVVSRTKTGEALLRVEREVSKPWNQKILGYTPEQEVYSLGMARMESGLFKPLKGSQAKSIIKTFQEGVFGREFSSSISKGGGKGIKVDSKGFSSGVEMFGGEFGTGRTYSIRGLGKIKVSIPGSKTQRTGKITGFVEEMESGSLFRGAEEPLPITTAEGIIQFKPLFRPERISAERISAIAIGIEPESQFLLSAKDIIPPGVTRPDRSLNIFKKASEISQQQMNQIVKSSSQRVPLMSPQPTIINEAKTNIVNTRFLPRVPSEQQGVYDIVEPTTTQWDKISRNITNIERQNIKIRERTFQDELQETLQQNKIMQKLSPKFSDILKTGERTIERQQQKILQRTEELQRQIPRQTQKTTTRTTTEKQRIGRPRPIRPIIPKLPAGGYNNDFLTKARNNYEKEYRLLIKRFGQYKPAGTFTRGGALEKGERIARTTLAASFKIEPTGKQIRAINKPYQVSNIFRTYKIKQGKKVALLDEFIQKRGTRLGSRSEVSEILGFKKRRRSR